MRHMNWALTLLLAAILIGCSASQPAGDSVDSARNGEVHSLAAPLNPQALGTGDVQRPLEDSSLLSSGSIALESSLSLDPALARLFAARDSGLPGLPGLESSLPQRGTSAVGREWQDGVDYLSKAPNAVETSTSLSLFTGAGQHNWAVYQLADVNGPLGFNKLTVETSNVNFAGSSPGFFVGLANYATGRWQVLDRSESETYSKSLASHADYLSPLGSVFLFVLTHDGNGVQLDRVGFDVDRDPPLVTDVSPSSGESGSQIQPAATFTGQVDSWSWDFGGGALPDTSTEQSPQISLGSEGSYSASVTATSVFGEHVFPFTLEVGPVSGSAPEIVSVEPLSGETGGVVNFTATVNGSVDSWAWDFGGAGTPDTSSEAMPQVTLGAEGPYNCSVTATNAFGSDQFDFSFTVNPVAGEAPVLISVSPLTGVTGSEQTFIADVSGDVDSWDWQFGLGASPATSTDVQPLETLGDPGTYSCSVTATNAFGNDTLNFDLDVTDTGGGPFVWTEVDLTTITGIDGGWTPSVAIADNGNPMVVYANLDDTVLDPFLVIGDSTLDLTDPASWTNVEINDSGVTAPAGAAYTDIVIPPGSNLPRVSLSYFGLTGATPEENSVVSFCAMEIEAGIPTWYVYYLGNELDPSLWLDGAGPTSIDFRGTDSHIGIAAMIANSNLPLKPANDMYYYNLAYDPLNPGNVSYTLTYNFGSEWRFPHLRYKSDGEAHAVVNGGYLARETGGTWPMAYENADSGSVGSLDLVPAGNTGMSYASISGSDTGLRYTELDSADAVVTDEDIVTVTDTGSGESVATMSQLAYMADGTACIVYTDYDGTSTMVRFAIQDGVGGWSIEDVSATPNTFTVDEFLVYCDLAHFANGNSIVCYSRFDSDVNTLRIALRMPAP